MKSISDEKIYCIICNKPIKRWDKGTCMHETGFDHHLECSFAPETEQAILKLIEKEVLKEKFQLKANIFTMFNIAMTKQELSERPPKGARFRTPLEELSIILENQVPTDDLAQLKGKDEPT